MEVKSEKLPNLISADKNNYYTILQLKKYKLNKTEIVSCFNPKR